MAKKLWAKSGASLNPVIEAYTVGDDYVLDRALFSFDIAASIAHVRGLRKIKVLTAREGSQLERELRRIGRRFAAGKITLTAADEDCHTRIESELIAALGAVGKKVHTGRSRNDQVLVAMRLLLRSRSAGLVTALTALARAFLSAAERYEAVVMPGYSHMQQAMLSSVGHYYAGIAESLLDDRDLLRQLSEHVDCNPLGSAAGFGVSFPLPRDFLTQELGFRSTQINSLYCQNSRGKFESAVLEGLSQVMLTLGRFASDILFFTTRELGFFTVDPALTTGSSIMPQKKNLDGLEILRGNVSRVLANQTVVKESCRNLMSGYNRDLQLLKRPVLDSFSIVAEAIQVVEIYLRGLVPNEQRLREAIVHDMFAADVANELVGQGVPFRDAYVRALGEVSQRKINLDRNRRSKRSLGAPGNLGLARLRRRLGEGS